MSVLYNAMIKDVKGLMFYLLAASAECVTIIHRDWNREDTLFLVKGIGYLTAGYLLLILAFVQ